MSGLFTLLKVGRPRFWCYTFGPYLLGVTAAAASRADLLDWRIVLFAAYLLCPATLLNYGVHDIFDYATDRLNAKKENYELRVDRSQHRFILNAGLAIDLPFFLAV